VRHADDLQKLQQLGLPAAITGRALLDGAISDTEVASFRQNA
jgi:phosphoribosylformimino-5-aminoimidazole carboxamide ribonucleotide (ProFAR) isomerase